MTKDEALKLALEALEEAWYHVGTADLAVDKVQPQTEAVVLPEQLHFEIS